MRQLTNIQRLRFSDEDMELIRKLRELKIKPTTFIRIAFREKIQRELSQLIKEEEKRKAKIDLPF